MKKLSIISVLALIIAVAACSDVKRTRGREYAPDMYYSRAYETYSPTSHLDSHGIHYDKMPVAGTVKRGELYPFPYAKDKAGDSVNYLASRQVPNPMPALNENQMKEAERLYLINCGICHGTKLDGNGPLYNGGEGPYAAAPRNLVSDPSIVNMPDGQMFYSITYGKGQMGPYGPQLSTSQRWMIVHYINSKQNPTSAGASAGTSDSNSQSTTAASAKAEKQ